MRRILRLGLLIAASAGLVPSAPAKGESAHTPRSADASNRPLYGPGDVYANIPEKDEFGRDQLAMFRQWNPDPVGLHEANLKAINPTLAEVVRRARADHPGLRFVVGSGRRDGKQQREAVAWGWSRTLDSPHRTGNAVDLWPLDAKGRVLFDPPIHSRVNAAMRQAAAKLGVSIRWGGHFGGFKDMDRSHFELVSDDSGPVRRTRFRSGGDASKVDTACDTRAHQRFGSKHERAGAVQQHVDVGQRGLRSRDVVDREQSVFDAKFFGQGERASLRPAPCRQR